MGQALLKNCPNCGKPAVEKYRPFCCARCASIDLGRWLGEKYVIPTQESPQESERDSDDDEA
jgi:uncharacterized protein